MVVWLTFILDHDVEVERRIIGSLPYTRRIGTESVDSLLAVGVNAD